MTSGENRHDDRDKALELERYRLAAVRALEQLEWCIKYLHRIRKDDLARALERNRSEIIERAMRSPRRQM
jgi:hypothetical protein